MTRAPVTSAAKNLRKMRPAVIKRVVQLRKDRKAKREERKSVVTPLKHTPWEESDDETYRGT